MTVLLEYISILCQLSEPDWFLETCEAPLEMPIVYIPVVDALWY